MTSASPLSQHFLPYLFTVYPQGKLKFPYHQLKIPKSACSWQYVRLTSAQTSLYLLALTPAKAAYSELHPRSSCPCPCSSLILLSSLSSRPSDSNELLDIHQKAVLTSESDCSTSVVFCTCQSVCEYMDIVNSPVLFLSIMYLVVEEQTVYSSPVLPVLVTTPY